jgi:hypothetical protein
LYFPSPDERGVVEMISSLFLAPPRFGRREREEVEVWLPATKAAAAAAS